MSVTYDGIVSSGSTSGVVDGDILSMPLTATIPASTPTSSTVLSIFVVAIGNRLTPGTPLTLATLTDTPPNHYAICWTDPPAPTTGQTSIGLTSAESGVDSPVAWQLGFWTMLEDNAGPIEVPMQLGPAADSGDTATVYWEIRQYTGLQVVRDPSHTSWPEIQVTVDGSGFGYQTDIPSNEGDHTAAFTGLVDTPAATEDCGTFASLPGAGLVAHVALAVGESGNTHSAEFNTDVDSITYHDAGFTDQTLWTTTVTNDAGTWSVGFAYAHYLNAPAGDLALGADFPAPSPASETFSIFGPPTTLYYSYPVEGHAVALDAGAGPEACTPVGTGFYAWQRL